MKQTLPSIIVQYQICPLWYNPNISEETLILLQWYRVGIIHPADLYNNEGNLFKLGEVRNTFATKFNVLDYYRIQIGLGKYTGKNGAGIQTRLPAKTIWPASQPGSHVAQFVGCWTHNPRVVGSIPSDANCFMWDNILGQDVNLVCASLHPGEIWVPSFKGYWLLCLAWQQ